MAFSQHSCTRLRSIVIILIVDASILMVLHKNKSLLKILVVESIEIYGQDIYYVPRTIVNKDTVFGEDSDSQFDSAKPIRAYVNNVEGWEGQGELLSKFGVRIEDKTTFIFSREKFKENVDDLSRLMSKDDQTKGT